MAAAQLMLPANRAFNSNGLPLAGAVAKLYTTGTLTPANFYADAALTVSLGSSLTANGAGRLDVPAYQDTATAFRLRVETSAGVELDDIDPFYFGQTIIDIGGSPTFDSRTDMAAYAGANGAIAFLSEAGREGMFKFFTPAAYLAGYGFVLTAAVTADTEQALHVAPDSDDTGASGAWVRQHDGPILSSWFGVKGDGVTNDTAALNAFGDYITFLGGGRFALEPGATHLVGSQTLHDPPLFVYYRFAPDYMNIMELSGLTKELIFDLNGAKVICADGFKYGAFNLDGTPVANVSGVGETNDAATPYYAMIYAHDCTGGGEIRNGELDGNVSGMVVGGFWGDTGRQFPCYGIILENNLPAINLKNIHGHHHCVDAVLYNGPATDAATSPFEQFIGDGCSFHNNGRSNVSVVGGRGGEFKNTLNYEAGKNVVSANGVSISSAPGAAIDFEAEGTKVVCDWTIDAQCQHYDCAGGTITHGGGPVSRLTLGGLIHGGTNYSVFGSGADSKFKNAIVVGTVVNLYSDPLHPERNTKAIDSTFSTDPERSPTGDIFVVNGHLIDGGIIGHDFLRCLFEKGDPDQGGCGNVLGPKYTDCTFVARDGNLEMIGRFNGQNTFVEDGGVLASTPGAVIVGTNDAGPSSGSFIIVDVPGAATTEYMPTIQGNGAVTFDSLNSNTIEIILKKAGVAHAYLGHAGAGTDFAIYNADGGAPAVTLYTAANARTFELSGKLYHATARTGLGAITAGSVLWYDATTGATLQGAGSSYDLQLRNKADAYFLRVPTGTVNAEFAGTVTATGYKVGANQVVGARVTGWGADTGTDKRSANATYSGTASVGYVQAEMTAVMDALRDATQTIKALKADLTTHGLIGA